MSTSDDLAAQLRSRHATLEPGTHYWIGLAGAPGSGKSTLAAALAERLPHALTLIPMDGYHYYRDELDAMDDPRNAHARRGAPFTFNAERFVEELIASKRSGAGSFPSFDHRVGDPVENAISLRKDDSQIVLVEGNYLLLEDEPWCHLLERVFDETWFLDVPTAECNRRTFLRHLSTGLEENSARHRIDTNDSLNAELVTRVSRGRADRLIRLA